MEEFGTQKFTQKTNSFGEIYIHELTHDLFKDFDSSTTFSQKLHSLDFGADSFYVICGTDSGLLINYCLEKKIPESARLVFVELPEIIEWLKSQQKVPELPKNICLIEKNDFSRQLNDFDVNSYVLQDRIYYIPSMSVQYGYYKPYTTLSKYLHEFLKTAHWNIRIDLDRKDFIIGQLENVAENRTPHSRLFGKFKGKTAVLLAGGPTLDDILGWVKKNRKKIVVFAVSRIAKKLYEAGLQPDFFVTVHTQPISFQVSKEMLLFHKDSILISHAQACPQLISQWRGPHLFMGHIFPWESKRNGPDKDLVGPTVSHAAYDVITKFGFKTIILGGVDLCFSQKNKSHATGSIEADLTVQSEGGDLQVITNGEEVAETTFAFHRGVLEFGKLAKVARNKGIKTFNPFSSSAKIDNVEFVQLSKIKLEPASVQKYLKKVSSSTPLSERQKHLTVITSELELALKAITNIREQALEGFHSASANKDAVAAEDAMEDLNRCNSITSQIEDDSHRWIYGTILFFEIHLINSLKKPLSHKQQETNKYLEYLKLFYTAIIVSCDRLSSHIQKALHRTQSRREELAECPDIDLLLKQWTADNQPGRAYIFGELVASRKLSISPEHTKLLDSLRREFDGSIIGNTAVAEEFIKIHEWNTQRLDKLRNRIFEAYNDSNPSKLESLISSLTEKNEKETASHLFLAQGLLHELQNDTHSALALYNRVVMEGETSNPKILEDSLSRIASLSLSLNDHDNAKLALQCLADLSLAHKPSYAEFLYLTGQKEMALEVYAEYIGNVPDDIKTMLRIGQIYKEMNSKEGVKMITDYILEKDPSNQTALDLQKFL